VAPEKNYRRAIDYMRANAQAIVCYLDIQPGERSIQSACLCGHLSMAPLEDAEVQELIYSGPNVMMGCGESAEGLAAGDELGGRLRAGDLPTCHCWGSGRC
jgi:hypothetical protein